MHTHAHIHTHTHTHTHALPLKASGTPSDCGKDGIDGNLTRKIGGFLSRSPSILSIQSMFLGKPGELLGLGLGRREIVPTHIRAKGSAPGGGEGGGEGGLSWQYMCRC